LSQPRHSGSDPSSPMRSRGLKRSHSPSIDPQDSESQDSYGGGGGGGSIPPQGGMMPGHPDSDFQGINEGEIMRMAVVVAVVATKIKKELLTKHNKSRIIESANYCDQLLQIPLFYLIYYLT